MTPPSGSAAYKKKDGTLAMAQDRQSVSWIPSAGGASGVITLPVVQITSMYCHLIRCRLRSVLLPVPDT